MKGDNTTNELPFLMLCLGNNSVEKGIRQLIGVQMGC